MRRKTVTYEEVLIPQSDVEKIITEFYKLKGQCVFSWPTQLYTFYREPQLRITVHAAS